MRCIRKREEASENLAPCNLKFTGMARRTILWQAMRMGNKNAPKREKKKPKQEKVKRGNFTQPAPRVVTEAPKDR
jgi:hypothetical protein